MNQQSCRAVIGLGFGDEGKGLTVGYLSSKFQKSANTLFNAKKLLNVRYSTGPQAAHRVVTANGMEKVFSVFGSGSFYGADTYLSEYVAVHLGITKNKVKELSAMGINPNLIINPKCPIITDFDMHFNQNDKKSLNHGTCGHGVWATFEREQNHISLLYEDIFNETTFNIKLRLVKEYYENRLNKNINLKEFNMYENKDFLVNNDKLKVSDFPKYYDEIIFESSQGLLLDRYNGFFPHITSSSVGTKNIINICSDNNILLPELYLITRAYQTRHGHGPITNQIITDADYIKLHSGEKNVHNQYQKEFKTSILDLDLLGYGIRKDGHIHNNRKTLVITCLDHINGEYRFTANQEIKSFSNSINFAKAIQRELNIPDVLLSFSECSEKLVRL